MVSSITYPAIEQPQQRRKDQEEEEEGEHHQYQQRRQHEGERHDDYEEEEEEEEEAAFIAQTQAFLRTCDAHRLAVHSLVQDLIDHSETLTKIEEEDDDDDDEEEIIKKQKHRIRVKVRSEENSTVAQSDRKKASLQLNLSSLRKWNSSNKPLPDQSTPVKTPSPLQNKGSFRTSKSLCEKPSPGQSYVMRKISSSPRKDSSIIKTPSDQSATTKNLYCRKGLAQEECIKESKEFMKPSLRRSVSSITNGRRRGNKPIRKLVFLDDSKVHKDVDKNVNGKSSLGSFFLKLTKQALSSGDNLETALDFVQRAVKHYEKVVSGDIEGEQHGIEQNPGSFNGYHGGVKAKQGGIERNLGFVKGNVSDMKRNHDGIKRNTNDIEQTYGCDKAKLADMEGYGGGMQENQICIERNHGDVERKCGGIKHKYNGIKRNQGGVKANCDMNKARLDLATSLHVEAAIRCSLGQYEEAARVLEQSIRVPDIEIGDCQHALAVFVGYMHLGDTFILLGQREEAFTAYHAGLEIQMVAVGDQHPQIGETCRYLAEAHAQALQFDKAEILCQHALDIWKVNGASGSLREASDRLLMGLICNECGNHEVALEHFMLARRSFRSSGDKVGEGSVEASIGDTFVFLGCLDKAVNAYQKALVTLRSNNINTKDNRINIASVYVSLAGVYMRIGKVQESRGYCETGLRMYTKNGAKGEVVACALTEIATIYESLNEHKEAISLLKKAICVLVPIPGRTNVVAGVEAQIGILEYLHRNYTDAHSFLSKALLKLRGSGREESSRSLLGMVLNHMGLVYVQLSDVQEAVKMFEESKSILEAIYGPHHPETLSVYSNLAGAYDALGRLDDAITMLSYNLEARKGCTEESGCIEVEDEKARLMELLKVRKTRVEPRRAVVYGHKINI